MDITSTHGEGVTYHIKRRRVKRSIRNHSSGELIQGLV